MSTAIQTLVKTGDQVFGLRPTHIHQCPGDSDGKSAHGWVCNSPYCEEMGELCVNHGGVAPVRIGKEPWRGR